MQLLHAVYEAAISAVSLGLPMVRAIDLWHISSVPEHRPVLAGADKAWPAGFLGVNPNVDVLRGASSAGPATSMHVESGCLQDADCLHEQVLGRTHARAPAVILRSVRQFQPVEARRYERWIRLGGRSDGIGGKGSWTDERLRLLAEEWQLCAGESHAGSAVSARADHTPSLGMSAMPAAAGASQKKASSGHGRPFMAHTGHLILPFSTTALQDECHVIGHGLALSIDSVCDWRLWEPFLTDIITATSLQLNQLRRL